MTRFPALQGHYFVTGTNTNVGKTWVCRHLLESARASGLDCYGIKPIAAGCTQTPAGLRNEDAEALRAAASVQLPYDRVNPVALAKPVAPHILAQRQELNLSARSLADSVEASLASYSADLVLVEGAGGWHVPLNAHETLADLVGQLRLPVLLVVGMELGCLNHSLLTASAIRQQGLELAGWVANFLHGTMDEGEANIRTLETMLGAPLLARTDGHEL